MSKIYLRIVRQYGTTPTSLDTLLDQLVVLGGDGGKMGLPSVFSAPAAHTTWNNVPTPIPGAMGAPLSIFKGDGTQQAFSIVGASARIIVSALAQSGSLPPQFFDVTGPVMTGGTSYNSVADTTFPRRYAFSGWALNPDGITLTSLFKTADSFPQEAYLASGGAFGTLLTTGTGAYSQQWTIPSECFALRSILQVGFGLVSPWGMGSTPGVGSAPATYRALVDITYVVEVPDSLFAYEQTAASDWYFSIAEKGSGSIALVNNIALAGVSGNTTTADSDANVYYLSFSSLRNRALLDPASDALIVPSVTHAAAAGTKGYIWNDLGTQRWPVASKTSIIAGFSPIVSGIPVELLSTTDIPALPLY